MSSGAALTIPKVWRSEMRLIIIFVITSIASITGSYYFPWSVITGKLFSLGAWRVECSLPLLWLIPASVIFYAMFRVYNVRFVLTSRGLDSYDWVLGPQSVMSIRYEDIRSLETEQSIVGRMLDVGDVLIGTAAQSGVEVSFKGIASPGEVLKLIQRERDKRHELDNSAYLSQGQAASSDD
jgi:uncharacterized membrane protein YdbT with pleckstrin-like domain